MSEVKHVLGISGGKDSAALALYMNEKYPNLKLNYYTCDTGRELKETEELISRLSDRLGRIELLQAVEPGKETHFDNTFDHFLERYGGYLPSSTARWCTKTLKLEPFERYIGEEPTISYVGIRGDEDREGYISKKTNVQSIFPFRKNIWSEDVIRLVLNNKNFKKLHSYYPKEGELAVAAKHYLEIPISENFTLKQKLEALLDVSVSIFNKAVFEFLKTTNYPIGKLDSFPLVENEDVLVIDDIFKILEDSGVGVPAYYLKREYEVEIDGELKKGTYSRSRSGCFFCFYQQKIEWVWLYENHNDLFQQAKEYEKDGYTWMGAETLGELSHPDRIKAIKKEHYLRMERNSKKRSANSWRDEIMAAEGTGCASCFI